jgi:hypothetical protein
MNKGNNKEQNKQKVNVGTKKTDSSERQGNGIKAKKK